MGLSCRECGAPLPESGDCRKNFHALLLLERDALAEDEEARGNAGLIAHFYAVSAYVLQHPEGMNYRSEALQGLRQAVADHLAGCASLGDIRIRMRRAADGPSRVLRRSGEPAVRWKASKWPMTVADVLAGGPQGYCGRVREWARSICQALDASER